MCSAVDSRVSQSIAQAAAALFARQRSDGSWPNLRPTAVLGTAGALAALHRADPAGSGDLIDGGVRWLLRAQNADGGWGGVPGAGTQLMPTVIAAATLHMVTPAAREPASRALALVEAHGGLAAFTDPAMAHMAAAFLALAGLRDPRGARRIPLELFLLPSPAWRRRVSFRVVPVIAMAFIQAGLAGPGGPRRLLGRPARRAGLRLLAQVERADGRPGGYGGDNWLAALVCLGLVSTAAGSGTVSAAVGYLRSNVQPDGAWHVLQGLDLIGGAYVARGLAAAGYDGDPRLARARQWLRGCQLREPFPVFGAPPGGWGWDGPWGWPNALDSANVLAALAGGQGEEQRRGLRWLLSRQDRAGSWGTFVRDTRLPNDGPCPYVTAQSIEALLDGGLPRHHPRVTRALNWLLANQRADGSYPAMWYRGRTPGTAMVLTALSRAGAAGHPVAARARAALLAAQLPDGSWGPGETGTPGDDPAAGTVEETSWALRALVASGLPAGHPGLRRAAEWIMAAQRPGGRWDAAPVCVYIRDFAYYVDGLIVDGLALTALAAYRAALAGRQLAGQEAT